MRRSKAFMYMPPSTPTAPPPKPRRVKVRVDKATAAQNKIARTARQALPPNGAKSGQVRIRKSKAAKAKKRRGESSQG